MTKYFKSTSSFLLGFGVMELIVKHDYKVASIVLLVSTTIFFICHLIDMNNEDNYCKIGNTYGTNDVKKIRNLIKQGKNKQEG